MLDTRFVRDNIDLVKKSLENRICDISFDEFLEIEEQRRTLLREADELKNKRNLASEEIGKLRSKKQDASKLIEEMKG